MATTMATGARMASLALRRRAAWCHNSNTCVRRRYKSSSERNARAAGDQVRQLLADKAGQINPTVGAAALVLGGALAARVLYGQLLGSDSSHSGASSHRKDGPRRENSRVTVKISTAAYDKARATSAEAPLTPQKLAEGSKRDNVLIDNEAVELTRTLLPHRRERPSF